MSDIISNILSKISLTLNQALSVIRSHQAERIEISLAEAQRFDMLHPIMRDEGSSKEFAYFMDHDKEQMSWQSLEDEKSHSTSTGPTSKHGISASKFIVKTDLAQTDFSKNRINETNNSQSIRPEIINVSNHTDKGEGAVPLSPSWSFRPVQLPLETDQAFALAATGNPEAKADRARIASLREESSAGLIEDPVPVNSPPTDVYYTGGSVEENSFADTIIARLSVIDVDDGDSHSYRFTNALGEDIAYPGLVIAGDEIRVSDPAAFDYENAQTITVYVRGNDGFADTPVRQIDIAVTDIAEHIVLTSGDDVFSDTGVSDLSVDGGAGNDTITGTADADTIFGGPGNDTLDGGAGNDLLYGGDGSDVLIGGDGDDIIYDGRDQDFIDGGEGSDTIYLEALSGESGLNFNTIQDTGLSGYDRLILAPSSGNTYDIQSTFNALNSGIEEIDGSLVSGEALESGDAPVNFDFSGIVLKDIDEIRGSDFDDTVIGSSGDDTIIGLSGNDIIHGGAGNDTIYGGSGTDRASFSGQSRDYSFTISSDGLIQTVVDLRSGSPDGTDTLGGIEELEFSDGIFRLVSGTSGNNVLTGVSGREILVAGGGNDILYGSSGADVVIGNDGHDVISYYNSMQGVTVDLADGVPESGGNADGDVLISLEQVDGSNFGNDYLKGGADRIQLKGWGGDDTLIAADGGSWLHGGRGNDTLTGGAGVDRAVYEGTISKYNFTLGAGDLIITDTVTGRDGVDTITSAIEEIQFTNLYAYNLILGSNGDDTLIAPVDWEPALIIAGDGNDIITGDIRGDWIFSGAGNDLIDGGGGNDNQNGGSGTDTAIYTGELSEYILSLSDGSLVVTDTIAGRDGADTLTDIERLTFNGVTYNLFTTDSGVSSDPNLWRLIDIANPSFERDSPADGTWVYVADGWTIFGDDVDAGTSNLPSHEINLPATWGENVGFGGAGTTSMARGLSQVLTETFDAGYDYRLTVDIGWANYNSMWAGGRISLYAGSTLIGDATSGSVGETGWTTLSFTVSGQSYSALSGEQLEIRLEKPVGTDEALFDSVLFEKALSGTTPADGHHVISDDAGGFWIIGSSESDILQGHDGDDRLDAGGGDDILQGHDGFDSLRGGEGNDRLYGGDGADHLEGGEGADYLEGGFGSDTGDYSASNAGVSIDLDWLGRATGAGGHAEGDVLDGIDNLIGSAYDDVLSGYDPSWDEGPYSNIIEGGGGNDIIAGRGGDDLLYGGDGSDTFIFAEGDGTDYAYGGAGGGWIDVIQLQDSSGGGNIGVFGTDWTVILNSGSIQSQDANSISLSNDADGTIVLQDGSCIIFQEMERIEWV